MQFTHTLGYLIHELSQLIDSQSDQLLNDKFGIGFAQYKLLLVLQERDNITQKEIALHLNQTEASISRQIKILRSRGLIQSTISPSNRREHIISLTLSGRQIAERAAETLNDFHSPAFEKLSESQQLKIAESLSLIESCINRVS